MALTPNDVLNKQFQTTKFRDGYDQDEVDDFLDEVLAEFQRLILTTRHGLALAQALRLDVTTELAEVTDIAATASIPVQHPEHATTPERARKPAVRPV